MGGKRPTTTNWVEGKKVDDVGRQFVWCRFVPRELNRGTKGLAISFISSKEDADILAQVQSRFEVDVSQLPDQIDISSYMNS